MGGTAIVEEALDRGHTVTGVSRSPESLTPHDRLDVRALDLTHPTELAPLFTDTDVAVLTLRFAPGDEHLLAPTTERFLDAAAEMGARLVVVGGAGALRSPSRPGLLVLDDPEYVATPWRPLARAGLDQLRTCERHPYDGWVYLSPPALFEQGPRTGAYLRGTALLLTDSEGVSRITSGDLTIAVVDEIEIPGGERHITVVRTG